MNTYQGSCHCRAVTFEVEIDTLKAIDCDCTYCSTKGLLLAFVPEESVRNMKGEEMLTEYLFNTKHISHLFCRICGVQSFGRAKGKEGNTTYAINMRSLQGVALEDIEITPYSGKDR
jgi:hypothetical protein